MPQKKLARTDTKSMRRKQSIQGFLFLRAFSTCQAGVKVISTGKELPPQASENKLGSAKSLWGEGFALAFSSKAYFQA